MTVKELRQKLKGQYTNIIPFHTDRRNALPFTQLGREFDGLYGKAFERLLDTKEVVDYELGEWKKTACWNQKELTTGVGHYEMTR